MERVGLICAALMHAKSSPELRHYHVNDLTRTRESAAECIAQFELKSISLRIIAGDDILLRMLITCAPTSIPRYFNIGHLH